MKCAVRATSAEVSTPGTAGISGRGNRVLRFTEVERHALTDPAIEDAFRRARQPWLTQHVPHEQLVIRLGQWVVFTIGSDSTLQPPVRRVQRVCVLLVQR